MSQELKSERIRFVSHAPGHWPDVPAEKWNDWKWQLKNRVSSLARLEELMPVTASERAGALLAGSKLVALDYAALLQFDRRARISSVPFGAR